MQNDETYLLDILESAKIAVSYLRVNSFDEYAKDLRTQDAIIRRIEIIGEASSKVSEETQLIYKDVPWKSMKGMRNFLIHEYNSIDLEIVWETGKK